MSGNPLQDWGQPIPAPVTQNITAGPLNAAGSSWLPFYGWGTMYMTESIGCGIITSVTLSMSANMLLRRTAGTESGGSNWVLVCMANAFVYTITTVMMSQSSGIFNPAVLFGYAILGRVSWSQWIILSIADIVGAFVGAFISYLQILQQLQRAPINKKIKDSYVYIETNAWRLWKLGEHKLKTWTDSDRNHIIRANNIEKFAYKITADKEYWQTKSSDDDRDAVLGMLTKDGTSAAVASTSSVSWPGSVAEQGEAATKATTDGTEGAAPKTELDDHERDGEYRAELIRDRRNKLAVFCSTPIMWSPFFIYPILAHIFAGTTLFHWISFITGTASQGTNTNAYLTQNYPARDANGLTGNTIAWQVMVSEAWLVGLTYFLLQVSAGAPNFIVLNPAIDLAGRLVHWLFPVANKGRSEWDYAWVPLFFPFVGATIAAGMMYMGMWAHFDWQWHPYGTMRV